MSVKHAGEPYSNSFLLENNKIIEVSQDNDYNYHSLINFAKELMHCIGRHADANYKELSWYNI